MPRPERSVKRPILRGVSPSLTSRAIGSNLSERRESRWGTRRMRWEGREEGLLMAERVVAGWGGGVCEFAGCWLASAPADRRRLSIWVRAEWEWES